MPLSFYHEPFTDERLSFITVSPLYQFAELADCNFIIYKDLLWDNKDTEGVLKALSIQYKKQNRFVIVFIVHDYWGKYKFYNNLILVRTSLYRSKRRKNEFTLPYIWETFEKTVQPVTHPKPQIGFCGQNNPFREKIIRTFQQDPDVVDNFIIREKFWGGAPGDRQLIDDFTKNLEENAFTIAQRGWGNFSMRFYQALALGRIPVLVDTDMELPFKSRIQWSECIVFEKDEESCLQKVKEVFLSGAYVSMQEKCKNIYLQYFSFPHFFARLTQEVLYTYLKPSITNRLFL